MLARQMFGYMPSLVIPGLLSFASVFCFTRLLQPDAYGSYVLAINTMTMLLGVGFFWLQSATSRLLPQEVEKGNQTRFTATLYALFLSCCLGVALVAGMIIAFLPLGDWRIAVWFAPPLAMLRALLNLNQAFHRNFVEIARYNIIEIGQAIISLAIAVILIVFLSMGAKGAALGMMVGLAVMAMFDWRMIASIRWRDLDPATFREIAIFGLPFIINYGLSFILARSDSFLIQIFHGAADVGIYNAGYAFPDRIGQYLFMAVATASLPLTIRRLESEGVEAARAQTYTNGIAVLALALPACAGLLLANRQIVATLIGPAFRDGALQVMPWITVAMILNGLAAHYFDHAFHFVKKTRLFFYTLGPSALLNFIGNLILIPHYGYIAAAWTTVASYALYLMLSIIVGRRVFKISFPFKPALHIALSTALMVLVLSACRFSETLLGLVEIVITGGAVYGFALLMFDVMGARTLLIKKAQDFFQKIKQETATHFDILITPAQIEEIADEWRHLYEKSRRGVFGSYEWHQIWWRNLGRSSGVRLYIAAARTASGELRAILPLVLSRMGLLRVAGWAGYEVFDYGDVLAQSESDAAALWAFAHGQGQYDLGLIKDVNESAASLPFLVRTMQQRASKKNYFLTLDFPSGEAWLALQSRKLRGDTRRKTEKMQTRGAVAFDVYRTGNLVPTAVIDALCRQKSAWMVEHKMRGVFRRPEIKNFLHELAQDAARQSTLYLAWLSCGDSIVACHMGFVDQGVLYLYHTTYDADYGAFSPGNSLMVETIKWAIDTGLRELDFMRGEEEYKARFATGQRALATYVAGKSWLGKAAIALNL